MLNSHGSNLIANTLSSTLYSGLFVFHIFFFSWLLPAVNLFLDAANMHSPQKSPVSWQGVGRRVGCGEHTAILHLRWRLVRVHFHAYAFFFLTSCCINFDFESQVVKERGAQGKEEMLRQKESGQGSRSGCYEL